MLSVKSNPTLATLEPETTIVRAAIRALFPARLIYAGRQSGEVYEWAGAGAVVMVNYEDVPYLLSKKIGTGGCCGVRSDGNKLFEELQEI